MRRGPARQRGEDLHRHGLEQGGLGAEGHAVGRRLGAPHGGLGQGLEAWRGLESHLRTCKRHIMYRIHVYVVYVVYTDVYCCLFI